MVLVFFPARLVETDPSVGDSNAQIDDAVECYKACGLVIMEYGDPAVKDVQKIVEFSRQFKTLFPKESYQPPSSFVSSSPSSMSDLAGTGFGFDDALKHLLGGYRMAADFMGDCIFIELQKPDEHSMNTEPYLKMVRVEEEPAGQGSGRIIHCEPWEPGRRSLFSRGWKTSKYQGVDLSA